ncbi:hypothetical protein CD58_12505 [Pseudomonas brassicacearum]|uniref:Uncharacterized protein n=1 Tax=Pseudomonas brassicacearum TaxID=930166 RepID=A0AAW8MED2_9PSED|nr:hypothetical protein [Pseudomonas brassicacearum]AHL36869.1 hypothetical protein CD58_12505 [Pseudomonas brassicacearum]MDR6959756.1 hypothetical protein [Pseudomonas brassicacearum]
MSAITVWSCIQSYRTSKAQDLDRIFISQHKIIECLEGYSGKDEYHGHESGPAGGPESPAATINLDKAIAYLELNKPTIAQEEKKTRSMNHLQKKSLSQTETLIQIINDNDNLGAIPTLLHSKATELKTTQPWYDIRLVWGAFEAKYRSKKNKAPQKTNYK